ncbi:MAG TPA: N-acetylglucosamine-specific PTS transporter subunit IIBC [Gammaproteobacteria bacterium]|nr:N-acetylglucosamine-specific PTS transporter subunit IIBC [Gammaproteobacteria bacterium]
MKLPSFSGIQRLGRALMLPIAVLPVAGLMLRLGQPDLLNISCVAQAGDAIFSNLPLLFAIGVAVGFAKENNGVAGLAGAIGYLVEIAVLKVIDDKINMGVLAGIIPGIVAAALYNRYKDIRLPEYLAFFGGKRFVPIVTGLAALLMGLVFGYIWPPIQHMIDNVGQWLVHAGAIGEFIYGFLNRLLIVTGLHHIINSLVWFVFGSFQTAGHVVTGDLNRYFAGDPTAGMFMAGFFPVMMFGLPAACLAMYQEVPRERRALVGGMLFSMALTSFLTGVTEPIEFAFMFLSPLLYLLHAVLTGLSLVVMYLLNVKLGFTFSAGAIDYLLAYGLSTHGWMLLPVGAAYFVLYYGLFRFFIRYFNLKTPGREDNPEILANGVGQDVAATGAAVALSQNAVAEQFITALGGVVNLKSVDACTTRLRLTVGNSALVSEPALKALGAHGVLRPGAESVQVVLGPKADIIADQIRAALAGMPKTAVAEKPIYPAVNSQTAVVADSQFLSNDMVEKWLNALGGAGNLKSIEAVATTRLRVRVEDASQVIANSISALGAEGVMSVATDVIHVVIGADAGRYADVLSKAL